MVNAFTRNSIQIKGEAVYDETQAFTSRQRYYLRIDCKLGFKREFKRSTLELAIDLQNLTNHKNVFIQQYNRRLNAIVTQYQQGFLPVPTVRWTLQ